MEGLNDMINEKLAFENFITNNNKWTIQAV
jgi:hypothetical protein